MSTVNEHGSMKIMVTVYPLEGVRPREKLYLLGFTETDNPEMLRRFACLSEAQANTLRTRLRRRGWLRDDGSLDLSAITSAYA